jgi:hypothetical protein
MFNKFIKNSISFSTSVLVIGFMQSANAGIIEIPITINGGGINVRTECVGYNNCYRTTYQTINRYQTPDNRGNCSGKGCSTTRTGGNGTFIGSYQKVISRVRISR